MRLLCLFLCPFLLQAQAWVKVEDFSGSVRDDGIAVVVGTSVCVGTGADPSGYTGDFKVFDLISQHWFALPGNPLPVPRQYACGFATDTCFFVTCGQGSAGALTSTYRYSFAQLQWTAVSPKPGAGLMSPVCFQFNNKIILAGGKDSNERINHQVWEYDVLTDSWQQKNNFPFSPLWRSAGTVLNGTGYLLGGIDSVSRFSKFLYEYQPTSDKWVLKDSLPIAGGRAYQAMQGINNRLFVFGGFDSLNSYYNDAFSYDPLQMVWHPQPAMPTAPRKGGMSFGRGQHFFYSCGLLSNGIRLAETWMTDVPTGMQGAQSQTPIYCSPNPVTDSVSFSGSVSDGSHFAVYTLEGNRLLEGRINQEKVISMNEFSSGLYLLKIFTENKVMVFKIQKL